MTSLLCQVYLCMHIFLTSLKLDNVSNTRQTNALFGLIYFDMFSVLTIQTVCPFFFVNFFYDSWTWWNFSMQTFEQVYFHRKI